MALQISTIRRWSALAGALLLLSGTLAACGGNSNDDGSSSSSGGDTAAQTTGGSSGGGGASTALAETAQENGSLSFSNGDLTAKAGSVTVTLENPSGNQKPHAIEIEGNGVEEETDTIEPGGRASVTVDLRPGRYTFYCPVGDHRAQGMEGTLRVQ